MAEALLATVNLSQYYPIYRGLWQTHQGDVKAVESVTLQIPRGEIVGLVGESGCGKSTLSRLLLLLEAPTRGEIYFEGQAVTQFGPADLRRFRQKVQVVFQDPFASLNPRLSVEEILADPLLVNQGSYSRQALGQVLEEVGLSPEVLTRYPHEFSGGQRQRLGIARALVLNPELILCDEAVSALDVSVQAQILNLLVSLQKQRGLSLLFISHDLGIVHYISDWIAVMYLGQIVELGRSEEVFRAPKHPYTQALLDARPRLKTQSRPGTIFPFRQRVIAGDLPSPENPPSGCYFHPRCPKARPTCAQGSFELHAWPLDSEHQTRCAFHNI